MLSPPNEALNSQFHLLGYKVLHHDLSVLGWCVLPIPHSGTCMQTACVYMLFVLLANYAGAHSHIRGLGLDDALQPRAVSGWDLKNNLGHTRPGIVWE